MELTKKIIIGIGYMFYSILTKGIVIKFFWKWFFANTFNLPELSLFTAFGIGLTIVFIVSGPENEIQTMKFSEEYGKVYDTIALLTPWFTLFFGWLIHLFA